MSDQDTMFNSDAAPEVEQPTNQVPEFLAEYVGGDKKYKTVEDALQSVPNAQAHIDRLEQELAQLRAKPEEKDTDQLVADIEKRLLESMQKTPDAEVKEPVVQKEPDQALNVDVNSIVSQVKSALEQEQTQKDSLSNQKSVIQAAINAWGDKAEQNLYGAAGEVGMSAKDIDALSAINPSAALKLLGIQATRPQQGGFVPNGGLKTNLTKQLVKPKAPDNWGNDNELTAYIREMAEYEAAGGKF